MTLPVPQTYVGVPREDVLAVFYDGRYQEGQLLEIKAWVESIMPAGYEVVSGVDSGMPYLLSINELPTQRYMQVMANMYVFLWEGKIRVLDANLFEILWGLPETP